MAIRAANHRDWLKSVKLIRTMSGANGQKEIP